MSLNSKIHLAHAVSWAFKAGKLDVSKIGELMQEQERTELQETALTAVHHTGWRGVHGYSQTPTRLLQRI